VPDEELYKPKLTIISIPKGFRGDSDVLQRRAIASWQALPISTQIILCGDDPGVANACAELGLEHIPDIPKNSLGTYYLNEALKVALARARADITCFVNGDIIIPSRLVEAINLTKHRFTSETGHMQFLIAGRRWDFDADSSDFSEEFARAHGKLHPPYGSDIFIFPTATPLDMPPFLIGRPYWDLWMFLHFRRLKIPVIDMTDFCVIYHPNHGYDHIRMGSGYKWNGVEGDQNAEHYALCGFSLFHTNLRDATYKMTPLGRIRRRYSLRIILFSLDRSFLYHPALCARRLAQSIISGPTIFKLIIGAIAALILATLARLFDYSSGVIDPLLILLFGLQALMIIKLRSRFDKRDGGSYSGEPGDR